MKNIFVKITGLMLLLCLFCQTSFAQSINLPKESKFRFGDNPEWANPSFNDSDWATQQLGKSFRKDSSYCWYRIKIIIPSSLKTTQGKGLKVNLGKIDDADETFFNGKLIGAMGTMPPNYTTQWDKSRTYIIPESEVQWDKENLIAVRIYNLVGGMGMWTADPYYTIEPMGWVDEVTVKQGYREDAGNGFLSEFVLTNKTDNPFNGTIKYWISNKDKTKILFTETKPVQLQGKIGNEAIVVFPNFKSESENVFQVGYQINDNNSNLFLKKEQLYIATYNLTIPVLEEVKPLVQNKIKNSFRSIPIQNQKFTGYLGTRFTQNLEQRLLKVDEDGLMGSYLNRPGIHAWQGEHVGKYLEAACNVWKLTGNPALKKQMDRIMFTLINTQLEDGYLGTYTPDQYWTSWDVWSHKYNLHGLLAYYSATGYKPALETCKKMGDLLCRTFGKNAGQRDIILAGEHVGMAATSVLDAMVELYKYTADKKYLDFCYYILDAWEQDNGPKVISAILKTGRVTDVGNRKAYEMLSNYVGLVKLYQLTGDAIFLKAVELAWTDVVKNRLYITGTASDHEHFQEDGVLRAEANANMGEGCVTTTWVQLSQNLFDITGDVKYLNQLEKSVYNQLLGAQNPQTGCVSYYTPLMNKKPFTCNITCCQSSVPRGIALVPNFTFGNINRIPTVLFYETASYKQSITASNKKNIDATFKIDGNFPESGNVTITVETSQAASFTLALRVPEWCMNYTAKVGDKVYKGKPNQFVTINRNWKPGEKISISFDMPVQQIAGGKSYPNQIAFQSGPQVLAVDKSLNTERAFDLIANSNEKISVEKPVAANATKILPKNWIGNQAWSIDYLNKTEKLYLVPFAEASQTEGDMRVWLPISISDPETYTPAPKPQPRINGSLVYGCRPGHPFLYRIPCQGELPIQFSVKDLPAGLNLDSSTGIITGNTPPKGEYNLVIQAVNSKGKDQRKLKIVSGEKLALTPPMGWNHWYAHYDRITDKMVREATDFMISSGMANVGYQYVNIDDCWANAPKASDSLRVGPLRDEKGNINTNIHFPDMLGLTNYIHSKGLKAGIYTSPGPYTCTGFTGVYKHEEQDAGQFAAWGFDFLKYDWCSYFGIHKDDNSLEAYQKPMRQMGNILKSLDRDIVFNLCQYGRADVYPKRWKYDTGELTSNLVNYQKAIDEQYAGYDGINQIPWWLK